jgi:two-component system NtrC family sensor kinase
MRSRIGSQLILGVGLVTAATIAITAATFLRAERNQLVAELTRDADRLSETIKNTMHDDMLENRRDNLHRQITNIGRQPGIDRVRLFNKEGEIMFSSNPADAGRTLDKRGEACYACHAEGRPLERLPTTARARIFRNEGGERILGIINPIQNQPSCYQASCHAHTTDASVLGILDVTVPLAEVDRAIAANRVRMAGVAAVAIAGISLLLFRLNKRLVIRPTQALLAGTRRVSEGDLTTRIPVTATHELGDLARAFNAMIDRLAEAQRQLTQADKLASVGRLAAGVAHEINNPLTGVLTYASLLSKRQEIDASMKADLDVIVRETKRCRDIVRNLLDFARQTPPNRKATDCNEVVRRALAVLMNQLSLNRVSVRLDLASGLPTVLADANQIQQVVVNLLLNAADAVGEKGGEIRVVTGAASVAPRGTKPVRVASCEKGCDLLDPGHRIGGLPSIHVLRTERDRTSSVHLDPVYGRFNHDCAEACEEGIEADYACSRCRRTLVRREQRCERCGAAEFAVLAGPDDAVFWCSRNGCHGSRWPAAERAGEQPRIEIRVEDAGHGIPTEALPHLFEPFFSTKGTRGTGLGLAVSWGIVDGHGGTIDVESEVGRGSRFTVSLPLEAAERHAPAAAPAA